MSSARVIRKIKIWEDGSKTVTYPNGSIEEYGPSGDLVDRARFSSVPEVRRESTSPALEDAFYHRSSTPFAMTPGPFTENGDHYESDFIRSLRTPTPYPSSEYVMRSRATTPVCYPYGSPEPRIGFEEAAEDSEFDDNSSEYAVEQMLERRDETPFSETSLGNDSEKENSLPRFFAESRFLQGHVDYIPPSLSASSDHSDLPTRPAEVIARMAEVDKIMAQTHTVKDCLGFGYVRQELGRMDTLGLVRSPSGLVERSESKQSVQSTESEDPILLKEEYYANDEMVPPTPPMSPRWRLKTSEVGPIRTRSHAREMITALPRMTMTQNARPSPMKGLHVFVEIPVHPKSAYDLAKVKRWNTAAEAANK